MMKRIVNKTTTKLKNNSGVTILFALLAFMVASVACIVIVSNASSSVKRTHSVQESTQDNLTIDSAANVLKNNIDGAKYVVYEAAGTSGEWAYLENEGQYSLFKDEITNISYAYYLNTTEPSGSFTISATNHSNVTVQYKSSIKQSDGAHIVTFKLSLNDSNMYVTFNVEKTRDTSGWQAIDYINWSFDKCSGKDDNNVFTN